MASEKSTSTTFAVGAGLNAARAGSKDAPSGLPVQAASEEKWYHVPQVSRSEGAAEADKLARQQAVAHAGMAPPAMPHMGSTE